MAQEKPTVREIVSNERPGLMKVVETPLLTAICLAAGVAFLSYILLAGLDTTGRHILVISLVRLSFLAGLIAVAATVRLSRGLSRVGLGLAAVSAVLNLVGAIGWVVTDGWSYNAFDADGPDSPPWYAYVIGSTAILFAFGTILAGIAAIRARVKPALAVAVLLAGLFFPAALLGDAVGLGAAIGHAFWTLPWLAVGLLTLAALREFAPAARAHLA